MIFTNKASYQILISLSIGMSLIVAPIFPANALPIIIDQTKAQQQPTVASVVPGKTTAISFKTDEIITFVKLSDMSKNTYSLNAPIESGQAKSIYLGQIQKLEIPGTTESDNPNLFVVTTNAQGKQQEYEITIDNTTQNIDSYKIVITPPKPKPAPPKPKVIVPPPENTVYTTLGEASPEDVELGLETSLKKGRLNPDDPVVLATREYIALTMNGTSSNEAVGAIEIPLALIQQLGSLGLQEDTRRRLLPLNSDLFSGKK